MSFDAAIKEAVASALREQLPALLSENLPYSTASINTPDGDELMTTDQLAHETRTAKITWVMRRVEGRGPRFLKIGRSVRYRRSDIQRYLSENNVGRRGRPPIKEIETTGTNHGRGKRTPVQIVDVK